MPYSRPLAKAITSKDILKFQRESGEFNAPDTAEELRKTVNDPDGDLRPADYERRFKGKIASVMLYNRVLTAEEVSLVEDEEFEPARAQTPGS